jgi:hypothetical protein
MLVRWIIEFLTQRQQRVFVNGRFSDIVITCTGSPQGCVLSPLLFIMYTDCCRSQYENSFLVKFSDDTALLSLLLGDESDHGPSLPEFVSWCDDNFLAMNVKKTKEMLFDFRRGTHDVDECVVHDEKVEIVSTYKYLGMVFDHQLKWDANTDSVVKRGQQRLYLLRKLNSFSVSSVILTRFCQSFIESLLTFSFVCWFNNVSVKDRNSLVSFVNISSKIIGERQRDLGSFCDRQTIRKAASIMSIPEHVLAK